jgi:molybdate transport system substrate-binding protein
MREKIETVEKVDLFASADMGNALKLRTNGQAAAVVMFTRNAMCGFANPEVGLTTANFADRLLDPAVKLGTSTPKADPGGDYTWEMFRLIDRSHPGALALLDRKVSRDRRELRNSRPFKSPIRSHLFVRKIRLTC